MVYHGLLKFIKSVYRFPTVSKGPSRSSSGDESRPFRVEDVRIWQLGEDFGTLKAQFTNLRRALEGRVMCFKDMPQLTLETYFAG
jgi:hypothetical protein